jgi:hypothetical protein
MDVLGVPAHENFWIENDFDFAVALSAVHGTLLPSLTRASSKHELPENKRTEGLSPTWPSKGDDPGPQGEHVVRIKKRTPA